MTIAVDFDGVVHGYSKGWHDGSIYDPPIPGSLEALHVLMEKHPVAIFTTRDVGQVYRWFMERDFSCRIGHEGIFWNEMGILLITNQKIAAHVYLDDRGIRFENWAQALSDISSILEGS